MAALPYSTGSWEAAFQSAYQRVGQDRTLPTASASKIEEWQFLNLRVLWIIESGPQDLEGRMIQFFRRELPAYGFTVDGFEARKNELHTLPPWIAYRQHLKRVPVSLVDLGAFALVNAHQQEIQGLTQRTESGTDTGEGTRFSTLRTRDRNISYAEQSTPTRPRGRGKDPETPSNIVDRFGDLSISDTPFSAYSPRGQKWDTSIEALYPRAADEQIVNTALVDLLQSITLYLGYKARWSLERKAFRFAAWEARVDGCLI
jgi:hypothetical protein